MSTIATTIAGPKTYSAEELQALHLAMNAKAKRKKMLQKTALVTMNLIVCLFMLFPLLYTISVAFMPSGELYTMAMNIVPKHPTLENFVEAFHKIPLVRFVLNSFFMDVYLPEYQATDYADAYEKLVAATSRGKVAALAEVGYLPDVDILQKSRIPWAYYMTWSKEFCIGEKYNSVENLKKMYDSEYAVTL